MCRTTDFHHGFLPKDSSSLMIKAFFIRFLGLSCKTLPDSLTLHYYLPSIVDGSKVVHSGSPAFLNLYRVVNVKTKKGEAIFGSREPVRASRGPVGFGVYLGDEVMLLKGMFRKEEEEWKLECECVLENDGFYGGAADVAVAVDGELAALSGRVQMRRGGFDRLEVIPEESAVGDGMDGGDDLEELGPEWDMMMDHVEGVKWAVDVGIGVMCIGVGYLVSKVSARSLRRLRLL